MNKNQCYTCQYNFNCTIQEERKFNYDETPCDEYLAPINNSKGMFNRLFTYKGRIRRMEYALTYVFILVLCFVIAGIGSFFPDSKVVTLLFQLSVIVLYILFLMQVIKRCHDVGKSGWWIQVLSQNYSKLSMFVAEK